MNMTLTILIIESIVVLLGISGFLFFLRLKKKSKKLFELNQILKNISSQEGERKAHLVNYLQEGYALSSEKAEESAAYMVEAEKQFIQQFIKEQIDEASVVDFHQNLCELLDQYLYFVPTSTVEENNPANVEQAEITTKAVLLEEKNHDSDEKKEEPDWGEAFAESGEEVDEQTKAVFDSNNEEKESDSTVADEEPDWGDAFAESGDEVDEQTKAGYEADSLETE